jgi:hypothetical protein
MPERLAPFSVVITTFDKRFEAFLVPLVAQIKEQRPNIEVIVVINGPAKGIFDEVYRANILSYLARFPKVFPTMFPSFQSLAKLWNRGALTASHERALILNDDLELKSENGTCFFNHLEAAMETHSGTFKINGSFSHFILDKRELIDVGFFDERLLGLGEEDGDFYWRFYKKYKKEIASAEMGLINNVQSDLADDGYTKGIRTASQFNRDFIQNEKYKTTLLGGYRGMFDKKVNQVLEDENQYPYELFYLNNKNKL